MDFAYHRILDQKVRVVQVGAKANRWMKLKDRYFKITAEGYLSDGTAAELGAPHFSLRPLLFLIYNKELVNGLKNACLMLAKEIRPSGTVKVKASRRI